MKKLMLIALAVLAAYMAKRAVRREAEVVKLLWVLLSMVALDSASSPKTRAVEARLNAIIPTIFSNQGGTIGGNVIVNGTHTVNGNMNVSGSHNVSGQVNAGSVSVSGPATSFGFTSHGSVSADSNVSAGGSVHASGSGQFDSGVSTPNVNSNGGSTNEFSGAIHTGGNLVADGNFSAGNFGGSYQGGQGGVSTVGGAPGSYSASYITSLASAINGCIARLNSSGLI